ncbi:peroxidase family protein [Sulfitobacter porphyrae]|uniref:Peroxidase family protein n=1 Tax=Sulfitobacter porphyrae TaxID=1246864 RepID=A0ABW2B4L5_9RHOB
MTAWWDASQIYGYDAVSRARVRRDPDDPAKLMMRSVARRSDQGDAAGYLPVMVAECAAADTSCTPAPMNPKWSGQEATAFPENWSIGMSFYHNLFAREHNSFVTAFRNEARRHPRRDPACAARMPRWPRWPTAT